MDFKTWLETTQLIYNLSGIVAFLTLVVYFLQMKISKNQLKISTMSRCVDIYRNYFLQIDLNSSFSDAIKYIDFIEEELFYFEKGFVHKDVAFEWLSGMVGLVPIYDFEDNLLNEAECIKSLIDKTDLLKRKYPRIYRIFRLESATEFYICNYDAKDIESFIDSRNKLCEAIFKNVKRY